MDSAGSDYACAQTESEGQEATRADLVSGAAGRQLGPSSNDGTSTPVQCSLDSGSKMRRPLSASAQDEGSPRLPTAQAVRVPTTSPSEDVPTSPDVSQTDENMAILESKSMKLGSQPSRNKATQTDECNSVASQAEDSADHAVQLGRERQDQLGLGPRGPVDDEIESPTQNPAPVPNQKAPSYYKSLGHTFIATEDAEGQPLPPRWVRKQTPSGVDYYVDHDNKCTWSDSPMAIEWREWEEAERNRAGLEHDLPHPWAKKWTTAGNYFYVRDSFKTWCCPQTIAKQSRNAAGALYRICFDSEKPEIWCENAARWLELLEWAETWEYSAFDIGPLIDILVDNQAHLLSEPRSWRSKIYLSDLAAIKFKKAAWPEGMIPNFMLFNSSGNCDHCDGQELFEARLLELSSWDIRMTCDLLAVAKLQWKGNNAFSIRQAVSTMATLSAVFNLGPMIASTVLRIMTSGETTCAPIAGSYDDILLLRSKSLVCIVFQGFYEHAPLPTGKSSIVFMLVMDTGCQFGTKYTDFDLDLCSSAARFLKGEKAFPSLQSFPCVAARAWLRSHWSAHQVEREFAFEQMQNGRAGDTEDRWKILARAMFEVRRGHLNVREWTRAHAIEPDATTAHAELFEEDIAEIMEEYKVLREMLDLHNTERALVASELSILETRRGLEEQHAIGRLTLLAYIFLPLTFITGVFGMNITPFGGGAPMWQFWVTTCCILFPSWIIGLSWFFGFGKIIENRILSSRGKTEEELDMASSLSRVPSEETPGDNGKLSKARRRLRRLTDKKSSNSVNGREEV